jgi:putative oxidoreductase
MTTVVTSPVNRSKTIALWVARVLMGALFLFASYMKLSGQPMMVAEFDQVGLGQWFRYLTGVLELIGGVAVLIPSFSAFAAVLLLLVDIGAFIAQVVVLHMDWIHTVVIALILAGLVYFQRDAFRGAPQQR